MIVKLKWEMWFEPWEIVLIINLLGRGLNNSSDELNRRRRRKNSQSKETEVWLEELRYDMLCRLREKAERIRDLHEYSKYSKEV